MRISREHPFYSRMIRMTVIHEIARQVRWIGLVFLFGSLLLPLHANAKIQIDYSLGFGGLFRLNQWTPLSVTLENNGTRFQGTLEILTSMGSEYDDNVGTDTYQTDVELDTRSTKSYAFTIFIESFVHPLSIRVVKDGAVIESIDVNLRLNLTDKPIIPVLGDKVDTMFLSGFPENVRPVYVRARNLPYSWSGYTGVPMMIMPVSIIGQLSDTQLEAITNWLSLGGQLVLNSGINYGGFLVPNAKKLLLTRVNGFKTLSEVETLAEFTGVPIELSESIPVLDMTVDGGESLVHSDGISLITHKKVGEGSIILLAFDYQLPFFRQWAGRPVFWDKLLKMTAVSLEPIALEQEKIAKSLIQGIQQDFPDLDWIIIICVAYVVFFGVVLYQYNKFSTFVRRTTLSLLTVIVGFSVVGVGVYVMMTGQDALISSELNHLITTENTPLAWSKKTTGIYTFRNKRFVIPYNEQRQVIRLLKNGSVRDQAGRTFKQIKGKKGSHAAVSMRRWGRYIFHTDGLSPKPVEGNVSFKTGEPELLLVNKSGSPIVDAAVFYQGRHWPVDVIGPNKRVLINLSGKTNVVPSNELFGNALSEVADARYERNTRRMLQAELIDVITSGKNAGSRFEDDVIRFLGWILPGSTTADIQKGSATKTETTLVELLLRTESN